MLKKSQLYLLCFISPTLFAGHITKENLLNKPSSISKARTGHRIYIKNGLNKKIQLGKYTIVLSRIDDKVNRIHLNSKPRNRSLIVEAFDRSGNKMKTKSMGENLSTSSTSNHKYIYKSIPDYIEIK